MLVLPSLQEGYRAVVFGASGGLGAAFVERLAGDPSCASIRAGARRPRDYGADSRIEGFAFDLMDEASIAAAAERQKATQGGADIVLVATGVLHAPDLTPEKTFRALTADALARSYALNAIGPALIARHFLPLLPRDRKSVFAALSARVGSISDNRSGGWHAYRAAKAALNQLIHTCAIELMARNPRAVCVCLHPGTVDTSMSRPFQGNVAREKLFPPERSAAHLLAVADSLGPQQSGGFFAWDGQPIPF